ncbi:hypothetical protein SD960_23595 [Flavobacterium sp. MMLR14_040]|uniref:hypothetical protein n=1 Tax=Flavobacterium sp. MMLR14_040 TaxID=3093843 RepID=UPI00299012C0|nr:hypothetical protein [Flavobacterium sp. MMLR14_040]MDW8853104.1 hypothetical protein [Flavobacterium sp. MMLR14_040]
MYYYYYTEYDYIFNLLEKLKKEKKLSYQEFKEILEGTYFILQKDIDNEDWYNLSLSVICHVSEYLPDDILLNEILLECISASRVFLYREMLNNKSIQIKNCEPTLLEEFAKNFYTLDSGTVLTKIKKIL